MARWAVRTRSHRRANRTAASSALYERLLGRDASAARWWRSASRCCSRRPPSVLFFRVGTGFFPTADEGGFVLDYMTPAGSALAETDRQVRAMEQVIAHDPGGRGLFAPHRVRARPVRHRAEHRRHPRAAEAAQPAQPLRRRDHQRPARQAARGGAARRHRVRPAAAGHARRSRRQPRADRGEDLRRRSGDARASWPSRSKRC